MKTGFYCVAALMGAMGAAAEVAAAPEGNSSTKSFTKPSSAICTIPNNKFTEGRQCVCGKKMQPYSSDVPQDFQLTATCDTEWGEGYGEIGVWIFKGEVTVSGFFRREINGDSEEWSIFFDEEYNPLFPESTSAKLIFTNTPQSLKKLGLATPPQLVKGFLCDATVWSSVTVRLSGLTNIDFGGGGKSYTELKEIVDLPDCKEQLDR